MFQELKEFPRHGSQIKRLYTVSLGGVGYFAVEMWLNEEDSTLPFWEPWDTGTLRYAERDEACLVAYWLAAADGLPYYLPDWQAPEGDPTQD